MAAPMTQLLVRCLWLVLAAFVFFTSVALVASCAPDVPVEKLKTKWAQAPSQFVTVQGMQVHLRDEGPRSDPVPLVLLHGTSASLHTWEGWAQALRGQRRVIRFDLPGFALTGPHPRDDYSNDAYVAFVRAVLDQLGVQRFAIAGNSLGGQIAWGVAAAMPDRVDRLVLVDAAGYPMELVHKEQSIPLGFRIAAMPALRPLAENILPRGVVKASVTNVYGDPAKVTPELVDQYFDMAVREGNRRALALRIDQRGKVDAEKIKAVKAPTLILWGGKDRLTPMQFAKWFARDIPGSRLVVFEDLGHVPHEEDPVRTVTEVKRFLGL
jgi:pimeloyl-ACP methyl ester carboxylesterase